MQKSYFRYCRFITPLLPDIKKLSNVNLLQELPFYNELSIVKNSSAFSGYARSYKIEIVNKKDPIVQSKAGELGI